MMSADQTEVITMAMTKEANLVSAMDCDELLSELEPVYEDEYGDGAYYDAPLDDDYEDDEPTDIDPDAWENECPPEFDDYDDEFLMECIDDEDEDEPLPEYDDYETEEPATAEICRTEETCTHEQQDLTPNNSEAPSKWNTDNTASRILSRAMKFSMRGIASAAPPEQYIPGLSPGQVGMLIAPGGTGKSFLLLELAVAAATDNLHLLFPHWPGFTAEISKAEHKVLYIPAEEDESAVMMRCKSILNAVFENMADKYEITRRRYECLWQNSHGAPGEQAEIQKKKSELLAMERAYDMLFNKLNSRLDVIPLSNFPPESRPTLPDHVEPLASLMRHGKYTLAIIDPLAQFLSRNVNENDNNDMTRVVRSLSDLAATHRAAVIVAHHTSKNSIQTGQSAQQLAARGASGIVNAARLAITMCPGKNDDKVILSYCKRNGCPDLGEIYFKREYNGFLRNVERCRTKGRTRGQTKNTGSGILQTDVLEAIAKGTRTRKARNNDDKQ